MSEDRRRQIIELIEREGNVRVADLSQRFEVSEVTIRKDLAELEERGALQRTHGGAAQSYRSRFNLSFLEKERLHAESKTAIATQAATFVREGDAVILDAGSTTLALARVIKARFHRLTVITCSIPIALELSQTDWDVILVGGQVRHHSLALIGPTAIDTLRRYHADRAFLGATGVTLEDGYSTPLPLDAELKKALMRAADEAYVLTDSSKLGHAALAHYAGFDEVTRLITDAGAPREFCDELRRRRVAFEMAGTDA